MLDLDAKAFPLSAARQCGRQARQRMETRARLVEAGRRLIGAHGVDGVAVAKITEEADVGVGSFYNYFASKQQLLDVVVAELTALLGAESARRTAGMDDPAERVAVCVRHLVRLAGDDPTWAWFVLRAADAVPRLAVGVTAPIERHVRDGIAAGRFAVRVDASVHDAAVAVHAVGGAILAIVRARLLGRIDADADGVAAEYVLRLLGLSPAAARAVVARHGER